MGVVYRAERLDTGDSVALKTLVPELADVSGFRSRFEQECHLTTLDHPNVVRIVEAGEIDGRPYMVMNLVDGPDLGVVLSREGRLAPDRALVLLGQIADALDAAHAAGLVHRGVKPADILVGPPDPRFPDGHAYLTDFGIARDMTRDERITATGYYIGSTLDSPAPEQIEGKPVDGRADLYALGCVLQQTLTGSPPSRPIRTLG
jgi:serine/threonine-protein kinase